MQIVSIICLFFMPESPRYLVSVGKMNEARKAFTTIANWNRKKLDWDESLYKDESLASCKFEL